MTPDEPSHEAPSPPPERSPPTESPEEGKETPEPVAEAPPEPQDDWQRRYHYLLADFENFRRRTQREVDHAVERARGQILLKPIDLHEGIEHTLEKLPPDAKALRAGLTLVLSNFDAFLKGEGVEPVARPGDPFRHDLHEAVGQVAPTPEAPDGTVAVVVQQGYRTAQGLLRPAKVMVARAPEEGEGAPETPVVPRDEPSSG